MFIEYTTDDLPIIKNTLDYYNTSKNNNKIYPTLCHSCNKPGKTDKIYPFIDNYKNIDSALIDLDFCLNCKGNLLLEKYVSCETYFNLSKIVCQKKTIKKFMQQLLNSKINKNNHFSNICNLIISYLPRRDIINFKNYSYYNFI